MAGKKFTLSNGAVLSYPSLEDARADGFKSGAYWAGRGQRYQAGGPWVPKSDRWSEPSWAEACEYAAKVNAEWRAGWKEGNV